MAGKGKHVVFDVVGTCVSYDAFYDAIEAQLGDRLRAEGISPRLFGYAWMETAEREYCYLDRSGRYAPSATVFESLFYRVLWMAGIKEPRKFATDDDLACIVRAYGALKARPGIRECHAKLRAAGFTVWAFTSGDPKRVQGYLADNGIDVPDESFVSCDTIGVGKPDPKGYRYVLDKLKGADETWFAAAHMWDATAAQHSGFRGAWCSVWEKEPITEVFGEPEVMADSLVEMAEKIIAASSR